MFLYISAGTSYDIYNRQFDAGLIDVGYQAQKFNNNIIVGLSQKVEVVSLSALPYFDVDTQRIEDNEKNIRFICIKNCKGKLHKINKTKFLIQEGEKIIKDKRPAVIICDAISFSHAFAALYLSRKYRIPSIAIVTDVPEVMCSGKMNLFMRLDAICMKQFSAFILLTAQMNEIVNQKKRPYIVMEGSCITNMPIPQRNENGPAVCIYSGSLWKKNAGLEYLIEGFLLANIPNCELHFYGNGELTEKIMEISEKHPKIKYMGCVTNAEMIQRLSYAALLINPRPSDEYFCKYSFPSKTFEYMASGVPVLMTKLPGIPTEYFNYVYTIDEENGEGVCNKLKEIFNQPSNFMRNKGLTARKYITENKNNVIQSQRILDFINSL
ncbi:MAG TPA: glycosyltransferase [Oscillospiraceae bacterium]|nr:glycosyltransferase [Oscillospiraceae bacterium]HPF54934.1 glycosyltransferase [Clostridiales bacterium]HPK34993.1 glycosyltransferase [Oscillospiraceae bacterium]HPR75551.1 glycosyltransferase [Oscillospiraceae bacterium]